MTPFSSNFSNEKRKVPSVWKKEIKKGFKAALKLAAKHDGTKGYFLGRRVHHGMVGGGMFLLGFKIDNPYIIGFGLGLMLDDIDDIGVWLDFEKGGDPNSFISFKK